MSAIDELISLYRSASRPPPGMLEPEGPTNENEFRDRVKAIARTLPDDQLSQVIKAYQEIPFDQRSALQHDLLNDLGNELHSRTSPGPSPSPSPSPSDHP